MKKIFLSFLVLIIAGLTWYLFLKKYDYQFQTTAKYGPGAVFYELRGWEKINDPEISGKIDLVDKKPFHELTQRMSLKDSNFIELNWELERLTDSTTAISLNVRSNKDQLSNRWDIINPLEKSKYIDSLKHNILAFKRLLNEHQDVYKISLTDSLVDTPGMDCICSTSKNIAIDKKAEEMMATISLLENYVLSKKLKIEGYPFVKVIKWNKKEDIIDFDFCFPVKMEKGLENTSGLTLKKYPSQKALKVIYNGNYRLSHIAWYDILNIAKERGYGTGGLPLEIFYDNPKIDVDELNWKAEVYLPIEEEASK